MADYKRMVHTLLFDLIARHPLPWRKEWDWTCEVLDAKDRIVAKCFSEDDAQDLINEAMSVKKEADETEAEVERLLNVID